MRRRGLAIVVALLMFAAPGLALAADDTPGENLGGYDGIASGVAISFQPFLPALLSTGDVPFEGSFGQSSSRVKSGGNAFGRGALIWPGSTAADLGPVLGVAFGQPELGSLIPKWPIQAQATQDDGEVITGAPPVATMRAFGALDRSDGDARIVDLHVPRIVEIEHIASTSTSIVTDGSVTSTSIVKLQGVSLLAGFIKAESIRSVSRTASIGSAASSGGDVDISGLKIGGVDVSVTDDGFEVTGLPASAGAIPGAGGEPFPNQSPEEIVGSVLNALGARITLFKSITKVRGGSAERMQPGVVLSVDNPIGGTGPIPPGRFDIFLAASSASSFATAPFSIGAGGTTVDVGGGATSGGSTSSDESPSISLGGDTSVGGDSVASVGDDLTDAAQGSLGAVGSLGGSENQRSDYRFDGLPIALVIGLLLLALVAARLIRNRFDRLLTPAGARDEGDET